MALPDDTTLGDARLWLRLRVGEGAHCPCCTQWAKIYRWTLYGTAVRALVLFYREGGTDEFTHSRRLKELGHRGQGDAARLRLWELAEEEPERREDGGRSGFWRVTPRGEAFVLGRLAVPKYVHVYDARRLRYDGPDVTIFDVLGVQFNYRAMMASA